MARAHAIISEDDFHLPAAALTFEGFREWAQSEEHPETGRIDFLAGRVEADMSPEELGTHGLVKSAIALGLGILNSEKQFGYLFIEKARVSSPGVYVQVKPDAEGWLRSPRFGASFRLVRRPAPFVPCDFTLERRG